MKNLFKFIRTLLESGHRDCCDTGQYRLIVTCHFQLIHPILSTWES